MRALTHELWLSSEGSAHRDDLTFTLNGRTAALLPLAASASLLITFYFFSRIQLVVLGLMCVTAGGAVAFTLLPLLARGLEAINPQHKAHQHKTQQQQQQQQMWNAPSGQRGRRVQLAACVVAGAMVVFWLFTGSFLLNNLLGIGLCIALVSLVRLPSVKVCVCV